MNKKPLLFIKLKVFSTFHYICGHMKQYGSYFPKTRLDKALCFWINSREYTVSWQRTATLEDITAMFAVFTLVGSAKGIKKNMWVLLNARLSPTVCLKSIIRLGELRQALLDMVKVNKSVYYSCFFCWGGTWSAMCGGFGMSREQG